ncbi:MAG: alpha-amylase [Mogibacterium sp.]|nr:alpha-amylase [Mogibacterium sp.]
MSVKHCNIKKKLRISICVLLCLMLCLSGCRADRASKASRSGDSCRTVYEIFVCSFCDSDGDGIGDLNGVRSKMDYISDLGFDAIWLTPVHPSATYHKYDVDDYRAIDPSFGTMEDYEALLKECHDKGIRVYMDLVLNHTSEEHEWFRAASDYLHELPSGWEPDTSYCKYFDYYNFSRQALDGYTYLEGTEWFYEAGFWSEMPDLNLSSEAVRAEIRDIMAFWLDKGVDGFRLDAVTAYYANDTSANTEFLRYLKETARSIDPECYIVGEAWTDRDTIAALYTSGIDSLFEFPFAGEGGLIARTLNGSSRASDYVDGMVWAEDAYGRANPGYTGAPFYTNHDMNRSASYYPEDNGPVTKMAYAMSLLMTGNAFVYYGEEIGMEGAGKDENKRAPMYWSDDNEDPDMCAGPPDADEVQMKFPPLADQIKDKQSVYSWFKEVIRVRNAYPAISSGTTEKADFICDDDVAAFFRRSDTEEDVLIVMNLRGQPARKDLSTLGKDFRLSEMLCTGGEKITYKKSTVTMPAYSIAVFTRR